MRHEDYKELLALESVGALEAGERRALEEHLSSCAECRTELRELSDAAAALAFTVAPVAPPARLRSRVLESVRAVDPSELRAVDPSEFATTARANATDGPNARRGATTDDARGLLRRFSPWQLLTASPSLGFSAAAAAIAIVILGAATLTLWTRTEALRADVARLSGRLDESQKELAGSREQLASASKELTGARDVSDLLALPGARVAQLAGKEIAPRARAVLAYDHSTGRAALVASGLPPAPAGKEYQLWLIADNKPSPGGTFKVDADGRARMSDQLPAGASNPTFAVTLERAGGESAPKGEMYLLGS
jgi:anti-sigma-K factor RskA